MNIENNALDLTSKPKMHSQSSRSTNVIAELPEWLTQVRAIGAVVCEKMNSQEDRILASESISNDLSNFIKNHIIPWAHSVNDRLSFLRDGLSLIYENLPNHLSSMDNQLNNITLSLSQNSTSLAHLQNYIQHTLSTEIFNTLRSQVQNLVNEKLLEISTENVNFQQQLLQNVSFNSEWIENVTKDLKQARKDIEDLQFSEPSNPVVLESSLEDKLKDLVDQKLEKLQIVLEEKFNQFNSKTNSLQNEISNLNNIITLTEENFYKWMGADRDMFNEKLSSFNNRFEEMAASHQLNLDDLRSRIDTLESENPTKLANIPSDSVSSLYPKSHIKSIQAQQKLRNNTQKWRRPYKRGWQTIQIFIPKDLPPDLKEAIFNVEICKLKVAGFSVFIPSAERQYKEDQFKQNSNAKQDTFAFPPCTSSGRQYY